MNTKTAPESCPFCGAVKKRHLPHIAFRWFECGTMTAPAKTPRRDQTPACADAERERLTQERDEARAELDDLLARVKRLEEAGDFLSRYLREMPYASDYLAQVDERILRISNWRRAKEDNL